MTETFNSIAHKFDSIMNKYDLNKRLEVVFKKLIPESIKGKGLLDAGCGTGWFSKEACRRGADVMAMDTGPEFLRITSLKCSGKLQIGSLLDIPFADAIFDYVVCSEVIEHTANPLRAINELCRVVKHGGVLVITTPNERYKAYLWFARLFHWGFHKGYENWIDWKTLITQLEHNGFTIEKKISIHFGLNMGVRAIRNEEDR